MNGKFLFGGPIPPFLMPFMNQEDPRRNPADDAFVPPRINKAIEFLELLALKRRVTAAGSDHQIETIEQDKLCPEEEGARDAALQCLAKYFDGRLEQNVWEDLRLQSIKGKLEQEQRNPGLPEGVHVQMTRMCTCPSCGGNNPQCSMCDGCGQLVFEPANKEGQASSFIGNMPGPLGAILRQMMESAKQPPEEEDEGKGEK